MRNLNDFVRALGGIHNVLYGIAGKIDLIPVPGGGSSSDDYSTTERQVGTWLDGETPVYEISLAGDSLPASNTSIALPEGADMLISVTGSVKKTDNYWLAGPDKFMEAYLKDGDFRWVYSDATMTGRPYAIVIRYTKTESE